MTDNQSNSRGTRGHLPVAIVRGAQGSASRVAATPVGGSARRPSVGSATPNFTRPSASAASRPPASGRPTSSGHNDQRLKRGARRPVPLPIVLGAMLVGGLCLLLALNTGSAAQELQQGSLTNANTSLSDSEQQLLRDLAAKQAPAALGAAAVSLGLVPNPNPAFLRLNADGSVTVLGTAIAATAPPAPPAPPAPVSSAAPAASAATSAAATAGTSTAASAAASASPGISPNPTATPGAGR